MKASLLYEKMGLCKYTTSMQQYESNMASVQRNHTERIKNIQEQHELKLRDLQALHQNQILTKRMILRQPKRHLKSSKSFMTQNTQLKF